MSSKRHQIMDAVIGLLDKVTGMRKVSEDFKGYDEVDRQDLPICFPIDTNEEHEQFAIGSGTDTMQAKLTILITVYVFDHENNTRKLRTDMILAINKAMLNNTLLESLILDIQPVSVQTDQGMITNYSLWNQEFEITYLYSRTDGG